MTVTLKKPRFYFGPMSLNIVNSVIEICDEEDINIGFIPSRRQIECESLGCGYVNRWSTEKFVEYVRKRNPSIVLERDHSGPLQGLNRDDGIDSISVDSSSGFDIVHIDPWKAYFSIEGAAHKTQELMNICTSINPNTLFEIGTEEGIRKYSHVELEVFLGMLENYHVDFSKIVYCVVQSGTNVSAINNTGNFNLINSKRMCEICNKFGLIPKEHNSDYLTSNQIRDRMRAGVQSFNIAPELGVLETDTILEITNRDDMSNIRDEFIELCFRSKKWKKWIGGLRIRPEKVELARISGHYIFSSEEFLEIKNKILENIDLDLEIKGRIKKRIKEIVCLEKL